MARVHDRCQRRNSEGRRIPSHDRQKHIRAQEIAEENNLPCVYLVDSVERSYRCRTRSSDKLHFGQFSGTKQSCPKDSTGGRCTWLCTAGGAYIPAMSDELTVKGNGTIFLAGPPLVKAATGEEVTAQDLGGCTLPSQGC